MSSINQDVFDKVSGVLQELFELSAEDIHPSSNLYQDLDIDSIDAVDLVVELKKWRGKRSTLKILNPFELLKMWLLP